VGDCRSRDPLKLAWFLQLVGQTMRSRFKMALERAFFCLNRSGFL